MGVFLKQPLGLLSSLPSAKVHYFFDICKYLLYISTKNGHFADVNCKLPLCRNISEFVECISADPIDRLGGHMVLLSQLQSGKRFFHEVYIVLVA